MNAQGRDLMERILAQNHADMTHLGVHEVLARFAKALPQVSDLESKSPA